MPSTIRGSDSFDSGQVVGPGQSWQLVTSSRALGTTYTNTTGKYIMFAVTLYNTAGSGNKRLNMYINGVIVIAQSSFSTTGDTYVSGSLLVPPGATYSADSAGSGVTMTLNNWWELR